MHIVAGMRQTLNPALFDAMSRYRYRVFVEKLGWDLRCDGSLEHDQFDREDTLYVIAQSEDGDVVGTARLLPTERPYLLGEVFPQLLNGRPPPSSPDVWELSRFAAVDFRARGSSPLRQFSSPIAVGLLRASLECAAGRGARRVVTVSPPGVERLLRAAGFDAYRLGTPTIVDGAPIFACSIGCPS